MKAPITNIMKSVTAAVALAVLLLPGCSYVMDAIEGAITERASFSIDAEFIPPNTVRITWDESDFSGAFAGYEIYMTETKDDEFAGYAAVAAGSNISGGSLDLPNNLAFVTDGALLSSSARSYNHDVSALTDRGIYFYRVGIIHWDQDDSDDRVAGKNGYTGVHAIDYLSHTDIDQISGYEMVKIP